MIGWRGVQSRSSQCACSIGPTASQTHGRAGRHARSGLRQVKRALRARLITQRCGDGGRYAPPPPSRWVIRDQLERARRVVGRCAPTTRAQLEHCWPRVGGAARPSTRGLLEHRTVGWPVARRALLDAISKIFEIASSQSECSLMTDGVTDARTGSTRRSAVLRCVIYNRGRCKVM